MHVRVHVPAQPSTPSPTRCAAGTATCIPASFGSGNTSATGASNFAAAYMRSTKVHNVNATVRGAPAGTFTAYCFTIIQHVTCVADKKNPCCRPGDEKLLLKKVAVGTGRSLTQLALQLQCMHCAVSACALRFWQLKSAAAAWHCQQARAPCVAGSLLETFPMTYSWPRTPLPMLDSGASCLGNSGPIKSAYATVNGQFASLTVVRGFGPTGVLLSAFVKTPRSDGNLEMCIHLQSE